MSDPEAGSLNPALAELVCILAEVAVEEYLAELDQQENSKRNRGDQS